jgi:hypothetical protein
MSMKMREDLPLMDMLSITCRLHPTARYLRKNTQEPRNLHWVAAAVDMDYKECPCPGTDLIYTDNGEQVWA